MQPPEKAKNISNILKIMFNPFINLPPPHLKSFLPRPCLKQYVLVFINQLNKLTIWIERSILRWPVRRGRTLSWAASKTKDKHINTLYVCVDLRFEKVKYTDRYLAIKLGCTILIPCKSWDVQNLYLYTIL